MCETNRILLFFLTDGTFLILGGQHIAYAVKERYDNMIKAEHNGGQGIPEESVDDMDKLVSCTVLPSATPLHVCKIAAGLHQARQRATSAHRMSNTVEGIVRCLQDLESMTRKTILTVAPDDLGACLSDMGVFAYRQGEQCADVCFFNCVCFYFCCFHFLMFVSDNPFPHTNLSQTRVAADQWRGVANVVAMLHKKPEFPDFLAVIRKHDGKNTFSANKLREYGQMLQLPYCVAFMNWVINASSIVNSGTVTKRLMQLRQTMYARQHVNCPDNHLIHPSRRMLLCTVF